MSNSKILIVDDEADIIKGLTLRLRAKGYETISAMDGNQATTLAIGEKPDLIILDIGLPAGDGHVVAQRVRNHKDTMHTPIIFLTARTADEDKMKAFKEGVDKYLTKPYQSDVLLAAVEESLNGLFV